MPHGEVNTVEAYMKKLLRIAEEQEQEKENEVTAEPTPVPGVVPPPNRVDPIEYTEPPKGVDPEKLERIIGRLHSLTTAEMRQLLREVHYPSQGNRKQLRQRIRNFYRKEYASFVKRNDNMSWSINKTLRFFDFLVVIDFECTCDEVIFDYLHEIIEFPAVLVDVKELKIIDRFRTFVKPGKQPNLTPFCLDFCNLTQTTINEAPHFPEAYTTFLQWMEKHSLGEEGRRYAFVTDGPHDFWKFFQFQCMLSGFPKVPHQFRHWINLKKLFEQKTKHKIMKEPGASPKERVTAIQQMLKHYGLQAEGKAHFGLDDSVNIARIAIELMRRDKVELRINERMSRKLSAYEERMNKKNDEKYAERNTTNDLHVWKKKLPLKLRNVTRDEFLSREYADCDSCDEEAD